MAAVPAPLEIFGELRTQFKSIKERYKKYKEGPHKFQSLTDKLDVLARHLDDMESLLRMFPNALPSAGATLFQENLARLRDSFKDESAAMTPRLTNAFSGSSSSTKPRRTFRANSLDDEMTTLLKKIDAATNQLQHLVTVLLTALKVDELATPKTEIEENKKEVLSMLEKVHEQVTPITLSEAYHDAVMSMFYNLNENIVHFAQKNRKDFMTQLKNMAGTSKEAYRPASNTPDLGRTVVLDFSPTTSLGKLQQSVLYGGSSEIVTAATGAVEHTDTATTSLAYGVLGMAGVGKTVALQALGQHKEVKEKFRDGVLYMTFGREATLQTAIGQIAKIMRLTGATTEVEDVRSPTSLGDAVDYAVMWFKGKICLYLIDDLWPAQDLSEKPAQDLPKNYFQHLRQLLRESPGSRMAVSTRSLAIAAEAECVVDFSPGETLGKASVDIFMAHATCHSTQRKSHELRRSVSTILSICSGLPIALSVAGCAVSEKMGTFENACDEYAKELVEKTAKVGSSLNAAILLSLESLEVEFSKLVMENSLQINYGISDLYTSLCVLPNHGRLPVSVLSRLWNLSVPIAKKVANLFRKMSLAKLELSRSSCSSPEDLEIVLHDLHLDFCQREAGATNKLSFWHTQLLKGYLESSNQPVASIQSPSTQEAYVNKRCERKPWLSSFWSSQSLNVYLKTNSQPMARDPNTDVAYTIMSFVPRPWWSNSVPEDGYIHDNLARHLSCAGRGVELAALLLEARWTEMRARIGGILSLKSDFAHLGTCLSLWEGSEKLQPSIRKVKQSFENIFNAVRLSWGRLPEGMRAFQFQVYGRLRSHRESNTPVDDHSKEPESIVDAYLKSVLVATEKPYLVPVSAFSLGLWSSLILEIPTGSKCASVTSSPCGRYIAAGAGRDIVIAKASTGEVLQRMRGHTNDVQFVAFAARSKKIVSGSWDKKVMVWEWESSSSPERVLKAPYFISGLAVDSDKDINIFFSTEVGLEAWDISTGEQSRKVYPGSLAEYICLAVCGKNRKLALGTQLGELIVLDSDTNSVVVQDLKAHNAFVTCGAFSPNGQYLATGSEDDTICLWDASQWTKRGESLMGHEGAVTSVAFSPDGRKIASSSTDETIRLWDVQSGQCVGISPKIASMTCVSFTSDGERVVSGSHDGIVRIWDACLEEESKECHNGHTESVQDVSISGNGLRLATASDDGRVRLWDTQTGEQTGELIGESFTGVRDPVVFVALSHDGRKLVSGNRGGRLVTWNTEACTQIRERFHGFSQVRCASFSCDGLRIISGSDLDIQIWNAETLEEIGYDYGTGDFISCVAESVDGCHVVCRQVSRRTTIRNRETMEIVWDSAASGTESKSSIPDEDAEKIIRNCGPYTPRLWPKCFPAYTDELYCKEGRVYSNLLDGKTMIADARRPWAYNAERKVFAFGLDSGAVAICTLAIEKPFLNFDNFSKLRALISPLPLVLD